MKELLLATQNSGKLKEIQEILSGTQYKVVTPKEVGLGAEFDIEETGSTFKENSELKALAFAQAAHLLTIADDSGLAVSALGGDPGVRSKRFFAGSDEDRNNRILELIAEQKDRRAVFVTDLCLYDPDTKKILHFEGKVEGQIADKSAGDAGFGYDPIFIPNGYSQTFAELGQDVKNTLSHRARALHKAKEYLLTQ